MTNHRSMALSENRVGRSAVPAVAGMIASAILSFVAGGCADGSATHLRDAAEVKQVVLQGDKPVLVDFYKGGCPSCIALDGLIDKLAEEYAGRVTVAKFRLVQPYFVVTSPELKDKYAISAFPTVILFVNGQETWRFQVDYDANDYRKAIDDALGHATTRTAALDIVKSPGE